ncbi:MAG: RidA family protein [Verrucomicrobiales bacterium]|jgi:enamine deaminase RidA (YjgF/YER057c/UK114 family)|nr:RidA family protein [Verrucomicrobiales bacterium]
MSAEARLNELGITLPPPPKQMGVYKLLVQTGNLGYLSGHGPFLDDGSVMTGRLGDDVALEEGQKVARQVGLNLLATLRNELGSLDRVGRLVKTLALVNCTNDFFDQPAVVNGFSDLFAEVFGEEAGIGARSAMGTNSLPGNIPVEIEIIVEIKD